MDVNEETVSMVGEDAMQSSSAYKKKKKWQNKTFPAYCYIHRQQRKRHRFCAGNETE